MSAEYEIIQRQLAQGWNTWNTRSVLSHVLLPSGLAINLGVFDYAAGNYKLSQHVREGLIGRLGKEDEIITPGIRSYDGFYTDLTVTWYSAKCRVQTAVHEGEQLMLVTPIAHAVKEPEVVIEAGFLWGRPGHVVREDDHLTAHGPDGCTEIFVTTAPESPAKLAVLNPYLGAPLTGPVGISTGRRRSLEEIQAVMTDHHAVCERRYDAFGEHRELYKATQIVMAWDTIYDPIKDRVISPVSRVWNCKKGGYALFCWDMYFAGYMAALDHRELAYANVIEITRERTPEGFVPNGALTYDIKSFDRSQPCVGSLMVREIYRKYREAWLVEEVFDDLLVWNEWWHNERRNGELLCWGSNPFEPQVGCILETDWPGTHFGAALESGLDNSPMWADARYNESTHLLELHSLDLNGLYIADCDALADLAAVIGRVDDEKALRDRAALYRQHLKKLWSEEAGTFLNRHTDTGEFSHRHSPVMFYALLARVATQEQAEIMVEKYFYNPDIFWGEWILPSISRSDPLYGEQYYWRGRIWAPLNFLVYLGLRNYDLDQAQKDLAEKSKALLLAEWLEHGHVHENYHGDTGTGCDSQTSDRFYHWGALLGLPAMMETGQVSAPETPLN